MFSTFTVRLPPGLKKDLDRLAKEEGVSRSHIVRQSLRAYIFSYRLQRLREKVIPMARKQGVFTDEDVFERV